MDPIYWLVALGVFVVLEMISLGLTSIWFAGGCLVAFVVALLGAPFWMQIVLFLAVSILLLIFTKPVVEKHLNHNREKTNVDSVKMRQGKVIEEIDNFNQKGAVLLDGMEWMARNAASDEKISVGARVIVQEVRGAHLEVVKIEEEQ